MGKIEIKEARFFIVDENGNETEISMDDVVEINEPESVTFDVGFECTFDFENDSEFDRFIDAFWWPLLPWTPFSRS